MQLMPATAVRLGVRNRFQIEENVRAGVEYLAWLMHLFRGDLRLVTAAYYAGECTILARGLDTLHRMFIATLTVWLVFIARKGLRECDGYPQRGSAKGNEVINEHV